MAGRLSKASLLKWRKARGGSSLGVTHCGKATFHWGERTYVMGVVNVSPDSFSGDGLDSVDAAVAQAQRFVAEGVDILDVGGESTRPGSAPISVDEELRRVIPVLERLVGKIGVPLSVDTYKLEVARRALDAGAQMINDIWGLKQEPTIGCSGSRESRAHNSDEQSTGQAPAQHHIGGYCRPQKIYRFGFGCRSALGEYYR